MLEINFSEDAFIEKMVEKFNQPKHTVFKNICDSLVDCFSIALENQCIKIESRYKSQYYEPGVSLNELIDNLDFKVVYFEVSLYFLKDTQVDFETISLPNFFKQEEMLFGGGSSRRLSIKKLPLKIADRFDVKFYGLKIDPDILRKILNATSEVEVYLPSLLGVWDWKQTFYNKVTGTSYFCKCFESAITKSNLSVDKRMHPHVAQALKLQSYKDNICHVCTKEPSDLMFCHKMYGSVFKIKYGAYIKKVSIDHDLDEKDAENKIREVLGVSKIGDKWVNETLLFNYVNILFSSFDVLREYSPAWLGRQRFDVYISDLNLAIEYQGKQHYEPIEFFGGQEAFQRNKIRDNEKLKKAKKNGVSVVYFTYKEELTEELVLRRLKKYIEARRYD